MALLMPWPSPKTQVSSVPGCEADANAECESWQAELRQRAQDGLPTPTYTSGLQPAFAFARPAFGLKGNTGSPSKNH